MKLSRIIPPSPSGPPPSSTAPRSTRAAHWLAAIAASIFFSLPCLAQQPPAGSNWQRVQSLPPGLALDIKSTHQHLHCNLTAVTADTLSCTRASSAITLQRAEITSIKIAHRGRSALIGGGIGAGALGITFFAATSNSGGFFGPNFERGTATAIGLVAGGVLGGAVGALTDFSKSTIYSAPTPAP